MAKFRLDALANLARQLAFTPHDTRFAQIALAEVLLHDLDPAKAYPIDFVVYRITGYQPKTDGNSDLLTGIALQHDLGLFIEQVSDTLALHAAAMTEPVLSIDDVTERFEVTSKTIQRWRRKGLPARRFFFSDGKRRVGFLLSSVERFIAAHGGQETTLCSAVADAEQDLIARHARRLASRCGCCVDEICLRIGKKLHRSPLTILHTLRKHDAEHPAEAIVPLAHPPLDEGQRARIARLHKRRVTIRGIARKLHQPRSAVYRAVLHDRVDRLNKRKVRFIDDALYHETDAAMAIDDIVAQQELPGDPAAAELRAPRDLPPYLSDLYRTPLLSPARERALFLKFNFHKSQFVAARRRLEPQFARARDLAVLESHQHAANLTKNDILRANLRLVVSVARRHVRPTVSLMELISEGNITLMRAVEGFDIHKGNRFSTYATLALMKGFAQAMPAMLGRDVTGNRLLGDPEVLQNVPDLRDADAADRRLDHEEVEHLLGRLNDRERRVLHAHYGLGSASPATYDQVAKQLGLTKQRVRLIEQTAMAKLRTTRV
jgi:RNA polymerase primary sigma factor